MNIGDVFLALRADGATFQAEAVKEAQKAGDAAGATLGSRLGKAASIAAKVGLGALSAGAALATKGLVELDDITAQFTADTGASAEEAQRARKAINEMAGRNLQPMREIGTALGKVHTDLGLTGDAAEKTTEDFLHFARVTKRDAAEEVAAFDDILDAWNLTADKSKPIMDALVASHQKYGGVIADDETALRDLAPALKAANQTWEDGLGLINLFKTAGVDASTAVTGITKALGKVKSPEELQRLIADISNTEDPFLRAQKAADLFGSKAGPKLANVLKPGIGSLESFKTSGDSVTGTLDKARDALDSTFGAKTSLMLKGFMSNLISLADGFGPLATGLASLASLGGALGLDKLAVTLSKKMLEVGKDAGQSLIDGAATAVGAAGTIIGNFFASRIENIVDPTKNTILGRLYRSAGSKAATIYLKALMAVDAVAGAISSAWARVPGSAIVNRAIAKAGALAATAYLKFLFVGDAVTKLWQQMGLDSKVPATGAGKVAGIAFRVGFVLGLAAIADDIQNALKPVSKDVHEFLFDKDGPLGFLKEPLEGAGDWLENLPWPLGPKGAPDWAGGKKDAEAGAKGIADGMVTGLSGLDRFAGKLTDDLAIVGDTADATGSDFHGAAGSTAAFADEMKTLDQKVSDAKSAIDELTDSVETGLFGRAINAGHEAQLKITIADLIKQREETHKGSLKYIELTGEIAENRKALFDLHLEEAAAKGPQAAIDFLKREKARAGDASGALQKLIDKYRTLAGLQGTLGPIIVPIGGAPKSIGSKRAGGGPVTKGKIYTVGEQGPETFVAPESGTIIPTGGALVANMRDAVLRLGSALASVINRAFEPTLGMLETGTRAIAMAGSAALDHRTIPTLPAQASDVARSAVGGDTYITNLTVPANPTRNVFGALDLARRYQQGGFINPKVQPV